MSRCAARRKVTSSPSSRMRPEEGSSSPAIIRSVVVLPQPDGPSRQKNSPSPTVKVESSTAVKSANSLRTGGTRISAIAALRSVRKLRDDDEHRRAEQDGRERPRVEHERDRLQHH